ncbi:hypothetical protein ACNPIB_13795 [Klebsiella pneumoniae]
MDFFPPQSFSDLLIFFAVMIGIVAPLLSVIGVLISRWLWTVVPAPKMQAMADRTARIRDAVVPEVANNLLVMSDRLERQSRWPFNGRKRP